MNIIGIYLFLLISSSSVLCGRIRRENFENEAEKEELADLPKLMEKQQLVAENTESDHGVQKVDGTTPDYEMGREYNEGEIIGAVHETDNAKKGLPDNNRIKSPENPISAKRYEKMLQKAILKIITGDLSPADMDLLKSLNYSADQVLTIRAQELKKKKNRVETIHEKRKLQNWIKESEEPHRKKVFDYESYNTKATDDYENAASNFEDNYITDSFNDSLLTDYEDRTKSSTEIFPDHDRSMEPNIIFKIPYNDSEFDSSSAEEKPKFSTEENYQPSSFNGTGNNFPETSVAINATPFTLVNLFSNRWDRLNFTKIYPTTTQLPEEDSNNVNVNETDSKTTVDRPDDNFYYENVEKSVTQGQGQSFLSIAPFSLTTSAPKVTKNLQNTTSEIEPSTTPTPGKNNHDLYKGLKWIQDDVYQVIPELMGSWEFDNLDNETSDSLYDDTFYQNLDDVVIRNLTSNESIDLVDEVRQHDSPDFVRLSSLNGNVTEQENFANQSESAYMILARRNSTRQKTMEDIKRRVLVITGRFNATSNDTPAHSSTEKLAMFPPICQIPRNTDPEAWRDPYSINMYFQPNLTSDQHVFYARLRLFKLPQEWSTLTTTSRNIDDVYDDEKKIRISVYFYTKPLKRHRSRKRLVDSVMIPLTTTGSYVVLDVRSGSKFWRLNSLHTNNHGLVVQVEDEDGRPLEPSHYIQRPNCHTPADSEQQDEKAYQRVPELFIRACPRYNRIVDGGKNTYADCRAESERGSLPGKVKL